MMQDSYSYNGRRI